MIRELCEKIGIEKEAAELFENCLIRIKENNLTADLETAMGLFFDETSSTYLEILEGISKSIDVHQYTVNMTFLLVAAGTLFDIYMAKGYSEEMFYNVMTDLKSKMTKCRKMYGIYGNTAIEFERGFYRCVRFAFKRLQFGKGIPFDKDDYKGIIKRGDIVCDCHIPASGPLLYDDVMTSLKQAHLFFKKTFPDGILKISLGTWLLYPPICELYPENSNLRKFYELFDIIEATEDKTNKDFWRIFYKPYSPDILDSVPCDTSLQKKLLSYIKEGGCMGRGRGILLFDGEKVL